MRPEAEDGNLLRVIEVGLRTPKKRKVDKEGGKYVYYILCTLKWQLWESKGKSLKSMVQPKVTRESVS